MSFQRVLVNEKIALAEKKKMTWTCGKCKFTKQLSIRPKSCPKCGIDLSVAQKIINPINLIF